MKIDADVFGVETVTRTRTRMKLQYGARMQEQPRRVYVTAAASFFFFVMLQRCAYVPVS